MSDQFFPQTINLQNSAVQLIETSLINPRVWLDAEGLHATDANGNEILNITSGQSAAFEGTVNAEGVTLPAYTTNVNILNPPPDNNILKWVNALRGNEDVGYASVEQIFAGINFQAIASLVALLADGGGTVATSKITSGVPGNTEEAGLEAAYHSTGVAVTSAIAGGRSATILDSNGNSNFVQNANGPTFMNICRGVTNISWPGGTAQSNEVNVGHDLGVGPTAIVATFGVAYGYDATFTVYTAGANAANFNMWSIANDIVPAPGFSIPVGWIAIS